MIAQFTMLGAIPALAVRLVSENIRERISDTQSAALMSCSIMYSVMLRNTRTVLEKCKPLVDDARTLKRPHRIRQCADLGHIVDRRP